MSLRDFRHSVNWLPTPPETTYAGLVLDDKPPNWMKTWSIDKLLKKRVASSCAVKHRPWALSFQYMTPRRNGLALVALLVRAAIASRYLLPNNSSNGATKGSSQFWYHLTISAVLVLAGGVFAGWAKHNKRLLIADACNFSLTLGLMGLDELHLLVLATSSEDPKEKQNAQKGSTSPGNSVT